MMHVITKKYFTKLRHSPIWYWNCELIIDTHQCEIWGLGRKYLGERVDCYNGRDQSRNVPSQWETSLQCNNVSHWLGAYLDSSLYWLGLYCAEAYCSGSACCCNDKEVCMHPQEESTKIWLEQLPWQQWDLELNSGQRILLACTGKNSVISHNCLQQTPHQLPVRARSYRPLLWEKSTNVINHQWRWDAALVMRRCVCTHNIHYEGIS